MLKDNVDRKFNVNQFHSKNPEALTLQEFVKIDFKKQYPKIFTDVILYVTGRTMEQHLAPVPTPSHRNSIVKEPEEQ